MDVLSAKKPLIVVVNEELMHNHQLELAEQLSNDGYLLYTTLQNFPETLRNINITTLKEYKQGNIDTFLLHLNTFMGF